MNTVYLVGYLTKKKKSKGVGVFSTEVLAKKKCITDKHFFTPLIVDEPITEDEWGDLTTFPGAFVEPKEKKSD